MKNLLIFSLATTLLFSCKKEEISTLQTELDNSGISLSEEYIIACAAGMRNGFMGDVAHPVSMFFYPV